VSERSMSNAGTATSSLRPLTVTDSNIRHSIICVSPIGTMTNPSAVTSGGGLGGGGGGFGGGLCGGGSGLGVGGLGGGLGVDSAVGVGLGVVGSVVAVEAEAVGSARRA
jgi:hypothetical protein